MDRGKVIRTLERTADVLDGLSHQYKQLTHIILPEYAQNCREAVELLEMQEYDYRKMGRYLYTVHRRKTDELIAFEKPLDECLEILGIKKTTFYTYLCKSRKKPRYVITKTLRKDWR